MLFVVSKVFWWIASPGNLIVVLMTIGTIASLLRRHRVARSALLPAALLALAITFLPVRGWLLAPL